MSKLIDTATSPRILNHAWRNLEQRDAVRSLWSQGMRVEQMRRDLYLHFGQLAEQLRAGSYRPEAVSCFDVSKASGGSRLICPSRVRDKLAQRAILITVEPLGEAIFLDASYGFRAAMNVDMAVARVREYVRSGYEWVVDADIRACFDNIPHQGALKALNQLIHDRATIKLVRRWLENIPAEHRPGRHMGLPQGMVLSPFLCNLYLHKFDTACRAKGIPWVRFADDFVLLARTEKEALRARQFAKRALGRLGLELHPDKTQVQRSSKRMRFLGRALPTPRRGVL